MKELIPIIAIITLLDSCDQKIIREPFDINHNVTCKDLVEQGYQWILGVDVILFGKISGDTLDYYQMSYEIEIDDTDLIVVEDDTIEISQAQKESKDELEVEEKKQTDSIFKDIYFEPINNIGEFCDCSSPIWRYVKILINAEDTVDINKLIDQKSMTSRIINEDVDYYISRSQVIYVY